MQHLCGSICSYGDRGICGKERWLLLQMLLRELKQVLIKEQRRNCLSTLIMANCQMKKTVMHPRSSDIARRLDASDKHKKMSAELQSEEAAASAAKILQTRVNARKEVNRAKGKELAHIRNTYPSADDSQHVNVHLHALICSFTCTSICMH